MERIQIEDLFKNSKNSDELFDAFQHAIVNKLNDLELYKILFWNPTLNKNEVCMYIKKLASEFPEIAYSAFMWGARVLELSFPNDDNFDSVINFYKKAAKSNPLMAEPYVKSIDLYNDDLKIPEPEILISFIRQGLNKVQDPVILYYKLAEFFNKTGNMELKNHYLAQGESLLKKRFSI